jgi:hypothetical protein
MLHEGRLLALAGDVAASRSGGPFHSSHASAHRTRQPRDLFPVSGLEDLAGQAGRASRSTVGKIGIDSLVVLMNSGDGTPHSRVGLPEAMQGAQAAASSRGVARLWYASGRRWEISDGEGRDHLMVFSQKPESIPAPERKGNHQ